MTTNLFRDGITWHGDIALLISTYFDLFHVFSTRACVLMCRNISKSNFASAGAPYTRGIFLSTLIKTCTKFSQSPNFQPLMCRFSSMKSSPIKSKIRTSLPLFAFSWRLLTATLGYGCPWALLFWALLFWAKRAPNSEMIELKIVK